MCPEENPEQRQGGRGQRKTHDLLGRKTVGEMPAEDIAREHAETGQHDNQRKVLLRKTRGMDHQRADIAVPAEDPAVAEHHRCQHEPGRKAAQEPELPFQPRIGQRLHAGHPHPYERQRHHAPYGDDRKGRAPRQHIADISAQRHAEQVGDGHPDDHDRNGLRALPGICHPLCDDRPDTEKGTVRQAGHETHRHQHPVVRRQRRAQVPDGDQSRERQQYLFQRARPGYQHRKRRPEANAQGIGRNKVSGLGDGNPEAAGNIGQDAHHHELRHPQGKRPECQCNQTFFHV